MGDKNKHYITISGVLSSILCLVLIINSFRFLKENDITNSILSILFAILLGFGVYKIFKMNSKGYRNKKYIERVLNETSLTTDDIANLEQNIIPIVKNVNIRLDEGEICHLITTARRYVTKNEVVEYRSKSYEYDRGRITRGRQVTTPYRQDVLDGSCGTLYITNKRVIYLARKDNFETYVNKILSLNYIQGGIEFYDSSSNYLFELVASVFTYKILNIVINTN